MFSDLSISRIFIVLILCGPSSKVMLIGFISFIFRDTSKKCPPEKDESICITSEYAKKIENIERVYVFMTLLQEILKIKNKSYTSF